MDSTWFSWRNGKIEKESGTAYITALPLRATNS